MREASMTTNDQIVVDPEVMDGVPTIKGTRIPVYVVLEMLEEGLSFEDILREYPSLTREKIKAAIHYAAECSASPGAA